MLLMEIFNVYSCDLLIDELKVAFTNPIWSRNKLLEKNYLMDEYIFFFLLGRVVTSEYMLVRANECVCLCGICMFCFLYILCIATLI